MHVTANKALNMVPLHIAPIRLTGHTFLDDKGLNFAHYNSALIGIGQRVGFCEQRIELSVVPCKLIPSFAGPIGQTQNLSALGAVVPVCG